MNTQNLDGNQKFWLITWVNIIIAIVLLASVAMYRVHQYDRIKLEALSKVADPIAFACAEKISYGSEVKSDAVLCMEKVRK
jgi:hypothetical protein